MKLEELTWPEVKAYLENKYSILIIPLGTCEQHGKHLPLNTDILIAEYFCNYISEEFQILTAPALNYGINLPCDKGFPGTVSLKEQNFSGVLSDLINEFNRQGFKKIIFITAHGDPIFIKKIRELTKENILLHELWEVSIENILEKQSGAKHGGEAETSLMLYLFPEKVKMDQAEDFETPWEDFKDYLHHKKTEPINGSPGNQGYPSYASGTKGEKIFNLILEDISKLIRKII